MGNQYKKFVIYVKLYYSNIYYKDREVRIFITKSFSRWAKKNKLVIQQLRSAANEIAKGTFDANLGGGVIKKRVATKGRGKSASVRTIVAFKRGNHCFFIYGFEKSERKNITDKEEKVFKIVAKELFEFSNHDIKKRLEQRSLYEVPNE